MSDEELMAALSRACTQASDAAAGGATGLISIAFDKLLDAFAPPYRIEPRIVRATKTLVFCEADALDVTGARAMTASAVRKVLGG